MLWAAKKLGVRSNGRRALRCLHDDTQGRDNVTRLELALDDELRLLGLRVMTRANMGAYLSNFAPKIPTASGGVMLSGVYAVPAIHVAVKGVFTHTVPVDAYRGAGRPEAAYAIERLIDFAARRLGVTPQELRRRNFVKPEAMPYTTPLGLVYDSGEFARNMDDALAAIDAGGFAARREAARARGRWCGPGQAVYIEQSGGGPDEFAELRFDPSGTLTILMGPNPRVRVTRPPTPSSRRSDWDCRPKRSAYCRATPTPSALAAAPAGRARCRSAVRLSSMRRRN